MVRIVCNAVAFLHGRYGLGIRNMGALYDEGNAVLPNHGLDVHRENSTKRFLVGASSENVMFAMVFLHSFELKTSISYTKVSGFVKGERNHGLSRTGFARPLAAPSGLGLRPRATRPLRGGRISARPGLSFAERERGMSVLVCGLNKTI